MSKINRFRKRLAEKYHTFELEEAVKSGEALLREHWNNRSMMTLGYARDIYNLARVYDELGEFERAMELYTDGAHLFSRHCTGDAEAYTDCLNNLAAAMFDMGMEEASFQLFGQLVSVKRYFGHEQEPTYADSLYNLANALPTPLRMQHANQWHSEALEIRKQSGNTQDVMDSLHSLAFLHEEKEEYEKAVFYAKTAMELAQGEDYPGAAFYLAELYKAWGRYEKAVPLYEEVMDLTRERVGRTHCRFVDVAAARAQLMDKMGRPREALAILEEIRALLEGGAGVCPVSYTQCLRHMAELYKQLGEYEHAEQLLLRSLKISRKNETDINEDIVHLIRLYLHRDDNAKALEILVYALMHSDAKGPGLTHVLTKLALAFNPSLEPAPETMLHALRVMNNRATLQPIIDKWAKWERSPFIPSFVMPPPAGRDKT
jgi:tetratricopeptide (TPR) repeat protein